jgi:hypothetical protein
MVWHRLRLRRHRQDLRRDNQQRRRIEESGQMSPDRGQGAWVSSFDFAMNSQLLLFK